MNNNKVSIGITGVIKAGKSTLLNAILHRDILGTAVVPETANLTVLKYSDEEKAKVYFWNKSEWDEIVENSKNDEDLEEWLEETEDEIENLSSYICDNSKIEDVNLDELSQYTSAKNKYGKLCNLVKYVELYTPLKYLQDGIEIIDTPGIDDPVVRREKITQNYLIDCDVMVHCMNSGQALTLKDVNFIIDNIITNNIYKLILVITRKDQISSSELNDVIKTVKQSLNDKFDEYKDGNETISKKFENILDKIEIVALSGKDALNHRIGKSDKTKLSIEETGIDELENTLDTLLFKENPKYNILVSSSTQEILNISNSSIEIFNAQEELKSKSLNELQEVLEELKSNKLNFENESKTLLSNIDDTKKDFEDSLEDSYKRVIQDISNIQNSIFNKVENYLYEVFQDGNKPDEDRIKGIIETNIKSNLIEIMTKYQDELQEDLKFYLKDISRNYQNYFNANKLPVKIENYNFDFDKLFGDGILYDVASFGIGGAIGFFGAMILGPIGVVGAILISIFGGSAYTNSKRDEEVNQIMKKLDKNLSKVFKNILKDINSKLENGNSEILTNFNKISLEPYNQIQLQLKNLEKGLSKQIKLSKDNEKELKSYREEITKKHNLLIQNISKLQEL